MSDRREARLLLALLVERWEDATALARGGSIDPALLSALARECDIAPTLHALLEGNGRFDLVGAETERALAAARQKCRMDNVLLLASLERVLDILARERIEPVALKGVDFLHRFYGSFDERTLDDIDLLVPPGRAADAIRALETAGWTAPRGEERTHWLRSSFEMPLSSPDPVPVALEIHWGLAQDVRYRVEIDPVLDRAVPCEIAGRRVRRLDDADAAAHLLVHHVQHYFDRRLKWGLDLARIAASPGFRWEDVEARVSEWGARGAAGLSLRHLRKILPGRFPPELLRRFPAGAWRLAATAPLRSGHPLDYFRGTRRRSVQLWIAAAAIERPIDLPGYLVHRVTRDRKGGP